MIFSVQPKSDVVLKLHFVLWVLFSLWVFFCGFGFIEVKTKEFYDRKSRNIDVEYKINVGKISPTNICITNQHIRMVCVPFLYLE